MIEVDRRPQCPAQDPTDCHPGPHVCELHEGHVSPEHLCPCDEDWLSRHPDCEHPGEYLRMGDHPDMDRFVSEDVKPDWLYCLRCEQAIEDWSDK